MTKPIYHITLNKDLNEQDHKEVAHKQFDTKEEAQHWACSQLSLAPSKCDWFLLEEDKTGTGFHYEVIEG
jgi:hypothetical protein